ncbi:Ku protein [Longispora sp. NPDC051575]|uniref:non-homologous end joining protein Ku n=1 Tax=Longispora sp. NPDC051575 TaxID=3154943 RepID=UPI0034161B1E
MPRVWKGSISFGLVAIPVVGHTVVEDRDVRFHQVHRDDGGRVRQRKVCEVDGQQVESEDIVKGFDIGGGEIVMLTDEDFEGLPLATAHVIDVHAFVPTGQIDPTMYDKPYYLEPQGAGALKAYALMRDALRDSSLVGIAKVAIRSKEQLAAIRVYDRVIVLSTLLWPDEVRQPPGTFIETDADQAHGNELTMAVQLIESRSQDWDPLDPRFHDDYRAAVQAVIEAKVSGKNVIEAPRPASETNAGAALDLMEALRASVAEARRGHAEPEPPKKTAKRVLKSVPAHPDAEPEPPKVAKKTTAKATMAKKAAAKKPRKTA